MGKLFIDTTPASSCVVNGTPRGRTPITLTIEVGPYSVTCVAKVGSGITKRSTSAIVSAGTTTKVVMTL